MRISLLGTVCAGLLLISDGATAQVRLRIYDPNDSSAVDPNRFLFNPVWRRDTVEVPNMKRNCRFRIRAGGLDQRSLIIRDSTCLSDQERSLVSLNEAPATLAAGFECGTGGIHGNVRGHINWFPVTATGHLIWMGYSGGPGDHDLTMGLKPATKGALTVASTGPDNKPAYHLEFYHLETLARLPYGAKGFWNILNLAMISSRSRTLDDALADSIGIPRAGWPILRRRGLQISDRDVSAVRLLNRRYARATGLFNLDAVHNAHSEIHPVYALAILVDTVATQTGIEEQWAVMVRDRGNEGDCATGVIPMFTREEDLVSRDTKDSTYFTMDLGWVDGASGVEVTATDSYSTDSTYPQLKIETTTSQTRGSANPSPRLIVRWKHRVPMEGSEFLYLGMLKVSWDARSRRNYLKKRFLDEFPDSESFAKRTKIATYFQQPSEELAASDSFKVLKAAASAERDKSKAELRQLYRKYPPLSPLPDKRLTTITDSTWRARQTSGVLAYRALHWHEDEPTTVPDCSKGVERSDFYCNSGWRTVLQLHAFSSNGDWTPMLGVFRHGHTWSWNGWRAKLSDLAAGFDWRLEIRREQFRRRTNDRKESLKGVSVRVTPLMSPLSRTVSSQLTVVPYIGISPGFSCLDQKACGGLTFGSGVGFQFLIPGGSIFTEVMRYTNSHHVESEHVFSLGTLVTFPWR
jgi:hypothetical protein